MQNNERWGSSSSGHHRPSKPKQLKHSAQLSLSDKKMTPLKLDQWIKTFRFTMEDECPGLSPADQARMLVHNSVRTDYNGQRFQDYVLDNGPTLDEAVDWIKDNVLQPVDTYLKEQAAATAEWRPSRETVTEFRDRLLRLTQEAMQSRTLTSESLVRAADRFFMGLTPDCRAALVERDVPIELEALHTAAAKWVSRQKALEFALGADDRRKRVKEKSRTATGTTSTTTPKTSSSPRRRDADSGRVSPSASPRGPGGRFQKRSTTDTRRRSPTPPPPKDTKTRTTRTVKSSDDSPSTPNKTPRSPTPSPARSSSPGHFLRQNPNLLRLQGTRAYSHKMPIQRLQMPYLRTDRTHAPTLC